MKINTKDLSSVLISDVEIIDYPDFTMAFVEEAYSNKLDRWLTELELEEISEDFVNEYIHENLDLYL